MPGEKITPYEERSKAEKAFHDQQTKRDYREIEKMHSSVSKEGYLGHEERSERSFDRTENVELAHNRANLSEEYRAKGDTVSASNAEYGSNRSKEEAWMKEYL